jgi:hypothetical protein
MSKVLQKITKYPFLFSFATSSIFVAFNIFFVGMGFDTNDDALMMHISAGSLSGTGSEYIIYSHIYLGQLYVWLYRCFPGYNWYPIFLVVIHWVSLTATLFFCNVKIPAQGKTMVVFFLLCVETLLLQRLQFTSTSLVAAFAGLQLCLMSIPEKNFTKLIFAFLLLLLSMLIRWESFLLVVFIGFLPLMFAFLGSKWRLFLFSIFLFGLLIVCIRTKQIGDYSDRVGQTILNSESDYPLRRIMDFPTIASAAGLESINWSENDFRLCKSWFWADSDFYTTENIKKLSSVMRFDFTIENKVFTMLRFIKGNFALLGAFLLLLFFIKR